MYEDWDFEEKAQVLSVNILLIFIEIWAPKSFRLFQEILPIIINNKKNVADRGKWIACFLKTQILLQECRRRLPHIPD